MEYIQHFISKKGNGAVPVNPCEGWADPCEFCNKRFGEWTVLDNEILNNIPEKPGFLMVALKNKNILEVVKLIYGESSIQKAARVNIARVKEQMSNKRCKETKSIFFIRWMVVTQKIQDEDIAKLCAHWYNYNILPKYSKSWPGLKILQQSQNFEFYQHLQKWCYSRKNPVWRKLKYPQIKITEIIKLCKWLEPCEVCDSLFTTWKPISEVTSKELAPNAFGLFMVSVNYSQKREVVYIAFDSQHTNININIEVKKLSEWFESQVQKSKFANRNISLELRWTMLKDTTSDQACFMFAHWLNTDSMPIFNSSLPGELSLEKNKKFLFKINEEKWYYISQIINSEKSRKEKSRKEILFDIKDAYFDTELE